MARLSLRLPESLHSQLKHEARTEGVSVNRYLVYLLARRAQSQYVVKPSTSEEVEAQGKAFSALLAKLETASPDRVRQTLDERRPSPPEVALPAKLATRLERHRTD